MDKSTAGRTGTGAMAQVFSDWESAPRRTTALYAVLGVLWILISDSFVELLPGGDTTTAQTIKGLFFVAATAAGLYGLLWNALRQIKAAHRHADEQAERFRQIAETIHDVFWISDPAKQRMIYVSPAYQEIWGRPVEELYARPASFLDAIHPDDRDRVAEAVTHQAEGYYEEEYRILRPDGEERWIRDRGYPEYENSEVVRVVGIAQDVTGYRALESQFQRAQRLEAVGQLTGGIAHDFNNLLTVILGNLDLVRLDAERLPAQARRMIDLAIQASERGADLTAQLLAFSRRQPLTPEALDVNVLVEEMAGLLGRTLGEDVELSFDLADELPAVRIDRVQLESALVNLAVNARDAMPGGGRLMIATQRRSLDETFPGVELAVRPGDYVVIEVSDSGIGIPEDVRARIFEPFFTTKDIGKGTGLGLSMVFGFLRQSGGNITVYSEPGKGTTFRLYLPVAAARSHAAQAPAAAEGWSDAGLRGRRILIVEDNPTVRATVREQLESLGCTILEAENGPAALALLEENMPDIDLLLSDVVMPGGVSGTDLAREARARWPGLRVLLSSGYPEKVMGVDAGAPDNVIFIGKPYRAADLADKLREALAAA